MFFNHTNAMTDFEINSLQPVSAAFRDRGITSFAQACSFVQQLPFKRNSDKNNPLIVLQENYGTCGTKHALLGQLAHENGVQEIGLVVGIYKMNGSNTPAVKEVLEKAGLDSLPEAHNYLRVAHQRLDFTKPGLDVNDFVTDLMEETIIRADQITTYKVSYHKGVLSKWLDENPQLPYNLSQIWEIREQCIAALAE